MNIERVAVIGCGKMGLGIARASALAGFKTTIFKVTNEGKMDEVRRQFESKLEKDLEKGYVKHPDHASVLFNLKWSGWSARHLAIPKCDLIIESVDEDFVIKQNLFDDLYTLPQPTAILASNTSTLSITKLAGATRRPDRFLGLHFFNPVDRMALVEVVKTLSVDEEVVRAGQEFARKLEKTPVVAPDQPGFLVNRQLFPFLLDAIRNLEEGVGTVEDLDLAMQLGCGHKMGPLMTCDLIGLDLVLKISRILHDGLKDQCFAPPSLLEKMVEEGWLGQGKEPNKGFYNYNFKPFRSNPDVVRLLVENDRAVSGAV